MISFNINFRREFEVGELIDAVKLVAHLCEPLGFRFEYTTGLKNGMYSETSEYLEKPFKSLEDFEVFLDAYDFRFDTLHLIQKEDSHKIAFSCNQKNWGISGKHDSSYFVEKIINLVSDNVLYAYVHNDLDLTLSRSNKYRSWKRKLGKVPSYVKYYENPRFLGGEVHKYLIDLESVPTHHHFVKIGDKLWFGACAIMYFSDLYYDYIPKEKWDAFTDCVDNTVVKNGLRKVVLYDDLTDFENSKNRDKQWKFRNKLGIDEVAHKLVPIAPVPETRFAPVETDDLETIDWANIKDALDALQIASGQTYGITKLKEILVSLEKEKVLVVEKENDASITLKSQHDLQLLINSYDSQIVISEIL